MFESLVAFILGLPQPAYYSVYVEPLVSQHLVSTGIINAHYASYLHEIIHVAVFYHLLYLVSLYAVFPVTFHMRLWYSRNILQEDEADIADLHKKLKKSDQQIAMHIVSLIQSLIVLELSLKTIYKYQEYYFNFFNANIFFNKEQRDLFFSLAHTRIFKTTPENSVIAIMATGYFLWDLFISLYCSTLPFVLHGLVSFIVYSIGMKPFINYYACIFLIFEMSNPFLNIRWFSIKYQFIPDKAKKLSAGTSQTTTKEQTKNNKKSFVSKLISSFFLINEIVFMFTFFNCRIVWGLTQIGILMYDMYLVRNDPNLNYLCVVFICVGNLLLDLLNIYWFQTMVRIAIKKITSTKK